ncbi:ribosome maturation factor RimM [Bacillus sp. REN16]|uniref:ribosome maturation factor RimM n=1 Tax=Bacillus sp. REN16 TaxID=2887296 RepID=UPI001E4CF89B|nr:ribosome maturation factor RimM [Bacillus sp. REN16]MCC3357495.1 ribosome maturation factor RimM [Bacillus sp. REN16]
MDKWYNVGKIVNTHGIKGEVRIISRTDFPEERYKIGNTLFIFAEGKEPLEVKVETYRTHKNFDLVTFEGYDNVNDVEHFKGALVKVHESQLGELEDGEYYFHEIIGCTILTDEGEELGEIKEILTPGANDVWVVKGARSKEILIPYIDEIVKEIDTNEKRIIIHLMEGLI